MPQFSEQASTWKKFNLVLGSQLWQQHICLFPEQRQYRMLWRAIANAIPLVRFTTVLRLCKIAASSAFVTWELRRDHQTRSESKSASFSSSVKLLLYSSFYDYMTGTQGEQSFESWPCCTDYSSVWGSWIRPWFRVNMLLSSLQYHLVGCLLRCKL